MKKVYDQGVVRVAAQLNKYRKDYESGVKISEAELKINNDSAQKQKSRRSNFK